MRASRPECAVKRSRLAPVRKRWPPVRLAMNAPNAVEHPVVADRVRVGVLRRPAGSDVRVDEVGPRHQRVGGVVRGRELAGRWPDRRGLPVDQRGHARAVDEHVVEAEVALEERQAAARGRRRPRARRATRGRGRRSRTAGRSTRRSAPRSPPTVAATDSAVGAGLRRVEARAARGARGAANGGAPAPRRAAGRSPRGARPAPRGRGSAPPPCARRRTP